MGASLQAGGAAPRMRYLRMDRSVRDAVSLLAQPDVDAIVVIDGGRPEDGSIVGIVTERDIFRAMATGGLEILDGLVWMITKTDFVSVDVTMPRAERLAQFCTHRTDQIAIMDGFALKSVQSIWDCVAAPCPDPGPA